MDGPRRRSDSLYRRIVAAPAISIFQGSSRREITATGCGFQAMA
jgi:hypothetical protein